MTFEMNAAEIVLVANIAITATFATGYLIIALTTWSQRRALWFAGTCLIGMLSPLSELAVPFSSVPAALEVAGYASFLTGVLALSVSFNIFHRKQPPWRAIVTILAAGLVARACSWSLPRDTLSYGFAYQLPLALAALLVVRTVLGAGTRTALHLVLAGLFGAIAVNLAVKPFFAVAFGSGATFSSYSTTTYAALSQASTGLLFLASGMILMLIVIQHAFAASRLASETDMLSGIPNRRGFDRQAVDMLARNAQRGQLISVAVFDLDHFKKINDVHGHQTGDAVIAAFGALLRRIAPATAIVGRTGGEEFAMMIQASDGPNAWNDAENIRLATLHATVDAIAATVSGGVAERRADESLSDLMRRADLALYRAKSEGRNRIRF
jgi:diguanylate cyclase (GGDEF)-like protein